MSHFRGSPGVKSDGKRRRQGKDTMGRNRKKQLHRIRSMLHCYFCGGRVVSTKLDTYYCEAEGISWDMVESLVIYGRATDGLPAPKSARLRRPLAPRRATPATKRRMGMTLSRGGA